MYFKIKDKILFRQYNGYGYITDNSMFGYKFLNDNKIMPGEKYVSESAAYMLSVLNKTPQNIDIIVKKLMKIFEDVEYYDLKKDTSEFFMNLVKKGFLSCGTTPEKCNDSFLDYDISNNNDTSAEKEEDCSEELFRQSDFLRSVHVEIASICNERCVHCYIPHDLKTEIMEPSLFYKIIKESRDMNVIHITLSGGEPLMHKDIIPFLAKCHELDLAVNVLTNLTLLTDPILKEMKKNPLLCVQTSLYSMIPEVHDMITKSEGSFEKTKKNLLRIVSAGIPVQISCPVMKQNKNSFYEVIDWGKKNNISVTTDYVIFASYDHSDDNLINRLSYEEVKNVFVRQLSDECAEALAENAKEKNMLDGNDPICSVCRYYFCVSAKGIVFPCVGWESEEVGDLKKNTVKEIWENSKEIQSLRQIRRKRFPRCVSCEDRGYCTVCMMCNSNENKDGNAFRINDFHCKIAHMKHKEVEKYLR